MQWSPTFVNCHICGVSIRTDDKKTTFLKCPVCGANFENRGEEVLRRKINCKFKDRARLAKGVLYLSDKRLIFVGDNFYSKPPLVFGGLVGSLSALKAIKEGPKPAEAIIELSGVEGFDVTDSGLTVRTRDSGSYEFVSREFGKIREIT